jgi:protein SCO1/2
MKALALAVSLWTSAPGVGDLTQHDLASVGATPAAGARAPLSLAFVDERGRRTTLGQALAARPALLVFADYTCAYLCGPGLVLTAEALDRTSLRPGRDYSFVVVGINPRDGPVEASAMRRQRLRAGAGEAAELLSGGRADLVAAALGYRYVYDARLGQYAHDTSVYVLGSRGQVARVLPEFALTPAALTLAVAHADDPPSATLPAPLRILCYCLQPLLGAYDQPAMFALRAAGVVFIAALAGGALALRRRTRRS